jgi:hypothetical protein
MTLGHSFIKRISSINDSSTFPDYKTTSETSVSRLKSFDDCVKAAKDASEYIISKKLERDRYIRNADKELQAMDEDIDNKEKKIETMKTHIQDILNEAFPAAKIDWGECTPPDQLEDHVFETPPTMPEEEQ